MRRYFNTVIRPAIRQLGPRVGWNRRRSRAVGTLPPDFDELTVRIIHAVNEFTMTSPERIAVLVQAVRFVVENRIEGAIALLRLDTDWYESTKHELVHLFPRLAENGPLIVDDYGHWQGQKMAVDEYFSENNLRIFLSRIDYTGRIGIKPAGA